MSKPPPNPFSVPAPLEEVATGPGTSTGNPGTEDVQGPDAATVAEVLPPQLAELIEGTLALADEAPADDPAATVLLPPEVMEAAIAEASGPTPWRVQVPGHPPVTVTAASRAEAIAAYNRANGILGVEPGIVHYAEPL